ncbi:actin-bundling T4SS effector WalE1 family protein [Wolbachia endosymbiont of Ctenocephalides felis wCfeJ]|uniref:actin-bundling T4SS effector WalE1 family protein n=1 Tax=Wolbachia endosymbiont of Ctenocephalides felis wCfeJ TaxID=2732594 RepID=UPI001444E3A1|nr:hypothetical protein [Wolbachia endosymbiont of Ctenocephalides felis wCfeJ]WCR58542.1 MAG: hypothetical protein PG980_001014 [Wolbachia endosymbiont of Ctenocephalides felis wCfeJ]
MEKIGEGVQNLGRKISDRGASISDLERIPYPKQESQGVVLLGKRELDPDLIDSNKDFQKDSSQSNSLSRSSSMSSLNSNSTNGSTAVLPNPKEHKAVKVPTSLLNKIPSWFKGDKKSGQTEVKYQVFPEGRSAENSTFYIDNPIYSAGTTATAASGEQSTLPESADKTATVGKQPSGKQPIQAPENSARSDSPDSGRGLSGSSTPTRSSSLEDITKAHANLKKTGLRNKLMEQSPSSQVVDVNKDVEQQNNQPHVK